MTHLEQIVLSLIIGIFIGLSVYSAFHESLTFDEIVYRQEGLSALRTGSFSIEMNNPPMVRNISAIPEFFGYRYKQSPDNLSAFYGRLFIVGIGSVGLLFVYIFTKRLFGVESAFVSTFLLAFDPTYFSHSHYITNDIALTVGFVMCMYSLIYFLDKKNGIRALFLAGSLGFTLASKIPSIPLLLIGIPLTIFILRGKDILLMIDQIVSFRFLGIIFLALLFVWGTYFFAFDKVIRDRNDSNRVSEKILRYSLENKNTLLYNSIVFLKNTRVPLGTYIGSIKNAIIRQKEYSPVWYGGNIVDRNQWYFLPTILLFKMPLSSLLLFIFSCAMFFVRRIGRKLIIIPASLCVIGLAIPSMGNTSPLIRYALPAIPFLYIYIASITNHKIHIFYRIGVIVILCWHMVSFFRFFPYEIAFANELLATNQLRLHYLSDSNIDWGQGLVAFGQYIETHQPSHVSLSYFGRDNGQNYGLGNHELWGSYKISEICSFRELPQVGTGDRIVAISITNWQMCGFRNSKQYNLTNVEKIVAGSILIMRESKDNKP